VLVVMAGLVAGGVIWVVRAQRKPVARETGNPALTPMIPTAVRIPLAAAPEEETALKLVRAFLAARAPADLEPLIRPSSQDPAVIVGKLADLEKSDGKVDSLRHLGPVDSRALQLEGVVVDFEGGRNRLALISPDTDGKWRVDFDAFDRHSSPDWTTLLAGKPVTGLVRVFTSPDFYYNGIYRDETAWACFAIASPDNDTLMYGYVPRTSSQFEALGKITAGDSAGPARPGARGKSVRVTLEILHQEGADPRQFEITRVLSDEWAIGAQPLDEKLSRPLSAKVK